MIAVVIIAFLVGAVLLASASATEVTQMGKLPPSAIRDLAAGAGFAGPDLDVAVAVAQAESAGDPAAVGDRALGGSVGLWQIYRVAHPEFALEDLTDPAVNAAAAYAVYAAADSTFTPWSTYKNGAYKKFLPGAV